MKERYNKNKSPIKKYMKERYNKSPIKKYKKQMYANNPSPKREYIKRYNNRKGNVVCKLFKVNSNKVTNKININTNIRKNLRYTIPVENFKNSIAERLKEISQKNQTLSINFYIEVENLIKWNVLVRKKKVRNLRYKLYNLRKQIEAVLIKLETCETIDEK